MKTPIAFLLFLMMLLCAPSLSGQNALGLELRGGLSFATADLGDADLKTGLGFEALIDYRFSHYLGIYAGWGWNQFSADRSFAGNDMHFEETGYLFGLQFSTTGNSDLGLYARVGGIFNHLEVENNEGEIIADSGHGIGLRLEAGLAFGLGSSWYLKPGVKYQMLSRDLTVETVTTPVDLKYIGISLGLSKRF